jgi:L-2-hydroxyglutarate oxidase LhgO
MSFVHGAENVVFLKKRFEAMSAHHCYHGMEYSDDWVQIHDWAPLLMEGRSKEEPVAATRIVTGTDVDFGALTHHLVRHLAASGAHRALPASRRRHRASRIVAAHGPGHCDGEMQEVTAKFVFIGAGGVRCAAAVGIPGARLWRLSGQRPVARATIESDEVASPGLWQGRHRVTAMSGASSMRA